MSYLYKKAEEATTEPKIDPTQLQSEIDKRTKELDQIKGSIWANQGDRTLLAALIGAGVGGVGGLLLAPKSETKNNFKRKLRYALLGAGLGGIGGGALMYGGIGSLIDSNTTSKQKEINELKAANDLDGSKVNSGFDGIGEVADITMPFIPDSLIQYRNEVAPIGLVVGDSIALTAISNSLAGSLSAAKAGADNLFRDAGNKVSKRQAFVKGIGEGFGKRTGWSIGLSALNAVVKSLTAGEVEQPEGE